MRSAAPVVMLEPVTRLATSEAPRQGKGLVMAGSNGSDASTAVAVIGTGIMGAAMARNLVAAGMDTRVWDRSASARRRGTRSRTRTW
jgi:phosphoglycerate dehydrogenase-like enzyme